MRSLILFGLAACSGSEDDTGLPPDTTTDSAPGTTDSEPGTTDSDTDVDGDGHGQDTDCDDADADAHPDADEVCDGVDNDCDGAIDDEDDDLLTDSLTTLWPDADGDGFGDGEAASYVACAWDGGSPYPDDCDDSDAEAYPAAAWRNSLTDCMRDADGDGFGDVDASAPVVAGTDCDDTDAGVSPGADEICDGANLDHDCDGLEDAVDAVDRTWWHKDADGDGYGDPQISTLACEAPKGFVGDDTDCDDHDGAVSPAASEVTGNERDDDCDGTEICFDDADDDGFLDVAAATVGSADLACTDPHEGTATDPATDCDDGDVAVNPGATEVCDNGVDDDCDGTPIGCGYWGDVTVSSADVEITGEGNFGVRVAGVGDVTGDGNADLSVAASSDSGGATYAGAIYVFSGPLTAGSYTHNDRHAKILGAEEGDYLETVAAGDIDGDGQADVVAGADNSELGGDRSGAVYLVHGPVSGTVDLATDADARLFADIKTFIGAHLATAHVDGDAYADVLLGAPSHQTDEGFGAGSAFLLLGPWSGDVDLDDSYHAQLFGENGSDNAGVADFAGDLNGDGEFDYVVGASGKNEPTNDEGAVYIVHGPITGDLDLSSADGKRTGHDRYHGLGTAVTGAGDVDGDGLDDLWVTAPQDDTAGQSAGAAYLVLGPASGTADIRTAHAVVTGPQEDSYLGTAIDRVGDLDDDGHADVITKSSFDNDAGDHVGAVFVLHGPISGAWRASEVDGRIYGELEYDYIGGEESHAGDIDGDGRDDVAFGSTSRNAAWLFYSSDI